MDDLKKEYHTNKQKERELIMQAFNETFRKLTGNDMSKRLDEAIFEALEYNL